MATQDQMDDGSVIRLAVTIDRSKQTALFDFEGQLAHRTAAMLMQALGCSTAATASRLPCPAITASPCHQRAVPPLWQTAEPRTSSQVAQSLAFHCAPILQARVLRSLATPMPPPL